MRLVKLARDMRPWRGGDIIPFENDVAQGLIDRGEGEDAGQFPADPSIKDQKLVPRERPQPAKHYRTKER